MTRAPLSLTKLVFVLPIVGFFATALVVLFGLPPLEFHYAQVLGGPISTEGRLSARVLVFAESEDSREPLVAAPVSVAVESSGRVVEELQTTGADGAFDIVVPYGLGEVLSMKLTQDGTGLARGVPLVSSKIYRESAKRRGGRLRGNREGEVALEALVESGVLAIPFRGAILVRAAATLQECDVLVSLQGGQLHTQDQFRLRAGEEKRLELTPLQHTPELEFRLSRAGKELGKWTTGVPVVAGAFFPEFSSGSVRIRSPLPRARGYFTWASETSRLRSGSVALVSEPDGTASGVIAIPTPTERGPLYLILASEPDVALSGTVGFPLTPGSETFDARDQLLLDGRPRSLAMARAKLFRVKLALVGYVGSVFLVTLVLFVAESRRSARAVTEQLLGEGIDKEAVAPAKGLALAAILLAIGLSSSLVWFALFAG